MHEISTIRAHDPFIVTDTERNCYWWVGDALLAGQGREGKSSGGVTIRRSDDLKTFSDPINIWTPPDDFFAKRMYWAPEIHRHNGRWYMFVTTTGKIDGAVTNAFPDGKVRGTMAFVADTIEGPYEPCSDGPLTPINLVTLDGTLYVDKNGKPWMVYCHEWLQVIDGTMEAIPLSADLKQAVGEPILLFKASDAPWSKGGYCENWDGVEYNKQIYVTDGCFMFHDLSGGLCMVWTTSTDGKYTTGISRSANGELTGEWTHTTEPLLADDGGHAMLFKTLDGRDMMAMHCPHTVKDRSEWLRLVPVRFTDDGLVMEY
jgi:GH43 family beta-xylosidase